MRPVLIAAETVVLSTALWAGLGETEAAPFSGGALTNAGAPIDVSYYRRHRSYYAYKSPNCAGPGYDEIRELQRRWPQTRWPPSMRCFPYR